MKKYIALITTILICTGCANWSTIDRRTVMPNTGIAIHLDAPQRLAYSNKEGHVCTEPTPDALQAYASALGGGLGIPTQGSASLTQALQTSAGSIGLHTQSITLMREILYRICEESYNEKLKRGDVVQLLERSQDLTLGVLAIEQLTGAVVSRQVIMSGGANATASSNVADTQAALDSVKKAEESKKKALEDAQNNQKKQNDLAKQAKAAWETESNKQPQDTDAVNKLKEQSDAQQKESDKADAAVTTAQEDYANAQKATKAVLDNFNTAVTSANSTANGKGFFSPGTPGAETKTIDKDTASEIAKATQAIVQSVLDKGHLTDACISMMMNYSTLSDLDRTTIQPVFELCAKIIDADITAYLEEAKVAREAAQKAETAKSETDKAKIEAEKAKPVTKPLLKQPGQ